MKKIKSLIPILSLVSTSLLTPTIVSCGQKVELIGGSTQLNSIYGDEGCDSALWVLKRDDEEITPSEWEIEFSSTRPTQGNIKVENGLVKWTHNLYTHLEAGVYTFTVNAKYKNVTYKTEKITLTVAKSTKDTVTGGKHTLNIECDQSGKDDYAWSAKNEDGSIVEKTEFSLESSQSISGISINSSGYIHWNDLVKPGTYVFKVKAIANNKTYYSDDITYIFAETSGNLTIDGGSTELLGSFGTKHKDDKQWKTYLEGQEVQASSYEIVPNDSQEVPSNITITNEGYVCWDDLLAEGEYTFKVKATYKSKLVISKPIMLKIFIPTEWGLYNGSETLNGEQAYGGQDTNQWVAKLGGEDVPATLSIVNVEGQTQGITIQDGYVKWPKALTPGEYKFKIHAEYQGQVPIETKVITLTIVATELIIKSGRTTYNYSANAEGSVDQAWKTYIKDEEVSSEFSLIPSEANQTVPSWLLIDEDGYISWTNDIEYGTYKFKIKAIFNEACEVCSDEITLKMVQPSDQSLFEWSLNTQSKTAKLESIKERQANVVVPSDYVDENGNVFVVNAICNFSEESEKTKVLKSIFIPDCAQDLGSSTFYGCTELTSISLPYYFNSECQDMCSGCSKIETIVVPDGWVSIPRACFNYCSNLKNLTLPKGLKSISKDAFNRCNYLTDVYLGSEIEFICEDAFANCERLRKVYMGNKITRIDGGAFRGCGKLSEIHYDGSKEDFNKIQFGTRWHDGAGADLLSGSYIYFNDGTYEDINKY